MAQAMSGGSFDTGIQKLTAMIFDFRSISPQVIKKCLMGHRNSRYSASVFIFILPLLCPSQPTVPAYTKFGYTAYGLLVGIYTFLQNL
jgi:hypothetical protein